ncbi:hypothetical protein MMC25_003465 [Agyrium rufum]|nr:hypothetical protein [Agyrium rufum]
MPIAGSASAGRQARPQPSRNQYSLIEGATRFWQRTYAAEYLGFALLLVAYYLTKVFITPFHRMFSLDNLSIQYPHAETERVPVPYLFLYAGLLPLLTILLWTLLLRPPFHKAHVTTLGLFISLILTSFLTDIIKNSVGRPRPDLIARCKPEKGTPEHSLVTWEVCTETRHHRLHDGWRSFPSGHSSFAFAGLGYLALVLAGQLQIFRPSTTDLSRVLLVLIPLLGALLIALSRLADYRHDVYDVSAGSLLGAYVAYFTYRRYYPSLKVLRCDVPHPSRLVVAKREEGRVGRVGRKIRDEEWADGGQEGRVAEDAEGNGYEDESAVDGAVGEESVPLRSMGGNGGMDRNRRRTNS